MLQRVDPASRKPTIREVAEAADVSRAAVSLVLNGGEIRISHEKREKIITVARELGYTPHAGARRLALRRMETLGLILPNHTENLSEQDFFGITHAAAMVAGESKYDLLLHFYEASNTTKAPPTIGRVDGSIVVVGKQGGEALVTLWKNSGQPHVIIGGGFLAEKPANYIDVDVAAGTQAAASHLIQLGHKNIGYISHKTQTEKLNGYILAMTKAKLEMRKEWIIESGYTENALQKTAEKIAAMNPRPTGLVFTNDSVAIRLIKHLRETGLDIPRDISVVGFDNIETAGLVSPGLTTVRMPIQKMAEMAVNHVMALIENRPIGSMQTMLSPELVIRDSTAAPSNPAH